jgi:hypothetical protein
VTIRAIRGKKPKEKSVTICVTPALACDLLSKSCKCPWQKQKKKFVTIGAIRGKKTKKEIHDNS